MQDAKDAFDSLCMHVSAAEVLTDNLMCRL